MANRLRTKTANIPGLRVFFFPMQDVRVGGRTSDSSYQYTLWDADYAELLQWAPRVLAKMQTLPGLVDVSTDREQGGLQVNIAIDRVAASRLGVRVQDIANALNNAYAQRQVSTLYTQRNQYRVILEIDPQYQRDPTDLTRIYVSGANNTQVPLTAVTKITRGLSPLVVNHQGQFPAITISFGLGEGTTIEEATRMIDRAVAELHIPDTLHAEYAGDARAYRQSIGAQPLLIIAALIAVYIVLGVLYESLAHPLTIISTLPSAGLGALLALQIFQHRALADRLHRHHPADRHRQEERHHDGRLRARGRAQARADAGAGDLRGLPGALPADHDDDAGGAARRDAADGRDRAGVGAAPAARHHHRRRAAGLAGAHALHDAGDLSAARPAAPAAVGHRVERARARAPARLHRASVPIVSTEHAWSANALPRIAIATGDPAGIGPEVSLKAALDAGVRQICRPLLVGDPAAIELHAQACGLTAKLNVVREVAQASWVERCGRTCSSAAAGDNVALTFGVIDAAYGRASLAAARRAIEAALAQEVDAVVAAPQTEKSIALAGIAFDGYPTFVARETGIDARDVYLMLCFDDYRVVNMTLHCSVKDALAMVTRERVAHVIRATADALRRMGIAAPRIFVGGLNPHAGEDGLFGREEIEIIAPAIADARAERHRRRRAVRRRHHVPQARLRRPYRDAARPGPHPGQAPRLRAHRRAPDRQPDPVRLGGARQRPRHRRQGRGQSGRHDLGDRPNGEGGARGSR